MIDIAICDDDITIFSDVRKLLEAENINFDFRLVHFYNGKQLIDHIKENGINFQILFMDVELGEESGIEVVKEIQNDYSAFPYVVFITSFPDYVYSVFEVSATDFISKPISGEKLKKTVLRIKNMMDSFESPYILIKDRYTKENIFVCQKNIVYIEMENSAQRLLKVVTTETTIYTYSRLSDFIDKLQEKLFVKIYRSIYVNLNHIISFKKKSLKMSDKSILPIGIKYSSTLVEHFEKAMIEGILL
ncbi:MAG: LytR/AlgR family response regulator transcription factor [Carnobacterium maltaromaticum]